RRRELLERAFDFAAERGARERLEERAAEIQRTQLRHRETGRQALEGLAVHAPPRFPVVVGPIVVERKAGFLERLQIAPDRARRHVAQLCQLVDRHASRARVLDLAQNRPLTNHLGISRHLTSRGYYSAVSDLEGFRERAIDAARWIDTIDPAAIGTTLYAGLPGHVIFQLELHRFTGESKYLRMSRAGADALLAALPNERE